MVEIKFEGKLAATIDDKTDPPRLLQATPEMQKLWDEFRKNGVPVMGAGPKIPGALTDAEFMSKELDSFLMAVTYVGYDAERFE